MAERKYPEENDLEIEESASSIQQQLNWANRKLPQPPGFVSLSVDSVITNVMQLLLVFTNIIVMFSSAMWLYALLIFPCIILWSVWKSFQNYRNQRNINAVTDIDQIENKQEQYMKMAETAYGVSHLGLLVKQASMIVCFTQDIPLLVLCAIIR
eukprot:330215_1